MRYLKLFLLTTMILLGTECCAAIHKYALLIGISEYQKGTDWNNINGTNDVDLLEVALKKEGFSITILRNGEATHRNIINKLTALISRANKGDVVYLHFSGHGQAVKDINGDEADGWDEAFIPYDASMRYNVNRYRGENHLLDDELGKYLCKLREKLGPNGMVYAIIDACHSGTMDRDIYPPTRGTTNAFSPYNEPYKVRREQATCYPIIQNSKYSKIIMLEACGAEESNQEVRSGTKLYGPLSLCVYRTVSKKGLKASREWIENVRNEMSALKINHKQRMIEQVAI